MDQVAYRGACDAATQRTYDKRPITAQPQRQRYRDRELDEFPGGTEVELLAEVQFLLESDDSNVLETLHEAACGQSEENGHESRFPEERGGGPREGDQSHSAHDAIDHGKR